METVSYIRAVTLLLILLFTYTAVSKIIDFDAFRGQMLNQPFPQTLTSHLVWAVPLAELVAVSLLVIKPLLLMSSAGMSPWFCYMHLTVFPAPAEAYWKASHGKGTLW